jgi:hypothetical protein
LLSYGNYFTELDFQKHKMTLISGFNASGKCLHINTKVTVRNKLTGEVSTVTIGDLYAAQKKQVDGGKNS